MGIQSNIEIMVLQGERWIIHARFPVTRKDDAIEEAKSVERIPGIAAVKVIKDVYDPKQGTSTEYIIYKSAGAKASEPSSGAAGTSSKLSPAEQSWMTDEEPVRSRRQARAAPSPAPKPKKKSRSFASIMTRLLVVLIVSLLAATAVTATLVFSIKETTFLGISLVGDSGANFYFAVFVVSFLLCASFMTSSLLGGEGIVVPKAHVEMPKFGTKPKPKPKPAQAPKPSEAPLPAEAAAAVEPPQPTPDELAQQLREAAAAILQATGQQQEAAAEAESPQAEPAAETLEPAPAEVAAPPLSPHAEKQKSYMLRFLGRTLEQVSSTHQKLDSYTKFGLNLFLSGACEVLSQQRELNDETRTRILGDGVQTLGFKREHAAAFAQNYESYLLQDARYMQMFQAGRNAMNTYFTDETEGLKHLTAAIGDWSRPKPKEEQSQVITVMFTDMVGSTALTQSRGQQVAQQVVRAHNRIVRQALTRFNGREIKHTGDGIMASFAQASGAVDASIQIQKDVAQHNRDYPDLPLKLKIGLNTGEPIAEDGDLFGSTVQLSARITDKATADEIFVPDSVRIVCAGRNYRFVNRGGFAMKGFDGDITLYEVIWDEEVYARKQVAPAVASAPAPRPAVAAQRPAPRPAPAARPT